MKITSIEIERFGIWRDLVIDGLSPGVNLFYGPNEAGKTTLLEFLRGVCFGLEPRGRYLTGDAEQLAGAVTLAAPEGSLRVQRRWSPGCAEVLTVCDESGAQVEPQVLDNLLAGTGETTFNHVFAVGLDELNEIRSLEGTEASRLLYDLSLGVDRVALGDVFRRVQEAKQQLFADVDAAELVGAINQQPLVDIPSEQAQVVERYVEQKRDYEENERRIGELEGELSESSAELERLHLARTLRPLKQRRRALFRQVKRGRSLAVSGDLAETVARLRSQLGETRKELEQIKQRRKKWRRRAVELRPNRELLRAAPRIESLAMQRDWLPRLRRQVEELEEEAARRQRQFRQMRERLGLPEQWAPDPDGSEVFDFSSRVWNRLRGPARSLRRAKARVEELREAAESATNQASEFAEQIASVLSDRQEENLSDAMDRLGRQVADLRRRIQLDERLAQMDEYDQELQGRGRELVSRQALSLPVLAGIGAGFIIGAILVLMAIVGAVFSSAGLSGFGGFAALLGVTAMASAVGGKYLLERQAQRRLTECQRQQNMLAAQREDILRQRRELDGLLGPSEDSYARRLEKAEEELATLEEFSVLESRRRAAEEEAESLLEKCRTAEKQYEQAQRQWSDTLKRLGLPADLSPGKAQSMMRGSDDLIDLARRARAAKEECAQRRGELDGLLAQVHSLLAAAGMAAADGDDPAGEIDRLVHALKEHQETAARRDRAKARLRKLEHRAAQLKSKADRLRMRLRRVYREAGARDHREFRKRMQKAQHHRKRREELAQVTGQLEQALAERDDAETVDALMKQDAEQLEAAVEQTQSRVRDVETHLQACYQRRGKLQTLLDTAAEDRTAGRRALEQVTLARDMQRRLRQWKVYAALGAVLHRVRGVYEHQRQPEALRIASGILSVLTRRRYRRVWTPVDEDTLLVDDEDGQSRRIEQLSRGTREQLFLALRLALASVYGRSKVELPVILDDVLVNFDVHRVAAAGRVLEKLARSGRQILVFTCHRHIVQAFARRGIAGRLLSEEGVTELTSHNAGKGHRRNKTETRKAAKRRKNKRQHEQKELIAEVASAETSHGTAAAKDSGPQNEAPRANGGSKAPSREPSPQSDTPGTDDTADRGEAEPANEKPERPTRGQESAREVSPAGTADDDAEQRWLRDQRPWIVEPEIGGQRLPPSAGLGHESDQADQPRADVSATAEDPAGGAAVDRYAA